MTSNRPLLLDLFCCEGGAAMGYRQAGFDVIGVDIEPRPLYPFPFIMADALEMLTEQRLTRQIGVWHISYRGQHKPIAAVHAAPPCQFYSTATASTGNPANHPDLIDPTRRMLEYLGVPYVIENVETAPLRPDVKLCGSMFDLQVRRHRLFELGGWTLWGCPPCRHRQQGRTVDVTGNAGGRNQTDRPGFPIKWRDVNHAREVMGMPWASGKGCTEATPPAYTEFIGRQLIEHLTGST